MTSDAPDASARIAALRRRLGRLARVRADGLRGRRHPAPARRRLRHQRAHRAVLPPGRRPLHPPHAGAAAPDVAPVPAVATRRSSGSRRRSRRSATTRSSPSREGEALERGERGEAGEPLPRAVVERAAATTTCCRRPQPGDALQLFADAAPAALAGARRVRRRHHRHDDRHDPAGPVAAGGRDRLRAARAPARGAPQRSSPRSRAAPARRTASINARVNRDVGARLGRQGDRGAAREGQPPARAGGRAS